jgi:2-keto-3-deoxy-6-phosphogluconate aldolase
MVSVIFGKILYSKVVDAKTKFGFSCIVFPESVCVGARMISGLSQVLDEVIVCQHGGLL